MIGFGRRAIAAVIPGTGIALPSGTAVEILRGRRPAIRATRAALTTGTIRAVLIAGAVLTE
jgi:hypothetical protein